MPILSLQEVSKDYLTDGQPVRALSGLSLNVERGEFVAIVGYSGAGKTTLISLVAGLIRPDRGSLLLNDLEITGPGPDRGIVFQNYSLLPWLSATVEGEQPVTCVDVERVVTVKAEPVVSLLLLCTESLAL